MTATRTMAIIGIVYAGLIMLGSIGVASDYSAESIVGVNGWLFITGAFLLSFGIVAVVQTRSKK